MVTWGELRKGSTLELDGEIYRVVDFKHLKLGRGSAQIRLRLKQIPSGRVQERTFQASEKFALARLEYRPCQFLYSDGDLYYFMDRETFEQIPLARGELEEVLPFLKENLGVEVLVYREKTVGVELPVAVELKVAETGPGFKGDTATGGTKPARVETGYTVQVPLFINTGDSIKVDTRTGEYLERVG